MKKILSAVSVILALCVLMGAYGFGASAAATTVTIGSAQASKGDTVKIDIVLSDCPKFSSYTVDFSYDSEYVTAVSASKGINVMLYQPNLSVNGERKATIVGGSMDNVTENGVLATVEFKISDAYPGGITEVPLKITKLRLTEFNGSSDVSIASQGVDGKLVLNGAGGSVVYNGGEELAPGVLTDDEAKEYTDPTTGAPVQGGGSYYFNAETKKAAPAEVAESGINNASAEWKRASDAEPQSSEGEESSSDPADEVHTDKEGADLLTIILCVAGGIVVVLAAVLAYIFMRKKNTEAE